MKLTGEVSKLENVGDSLRVTLTNVRRNTAANWQPFGPNLQIDVPMANQSTYAVGKIVKLEVEAK